MSHLSLKSILLTLGILSIPLFGYVIWNATGTPDTLSLLTQDYQETGTAVKQDFQSTPALPLTEEESSFTLTDTTAEGIDIQFANETNSGSTPVDKKALNISFPKDYSKPIEVKLDDTRTITITDLGGNNDYTADTLSGEVSPDALSSIEGSQNFFQKLFGKKKALSQNYLRYTSKDERKSLLYAYQKDQATGEKKLKHWTFYQEGNGVEQESYQIDQVKVRVNQEGVAEVFYYGEQNLKNDQAAAEVDSNLMERAQRTLEKEMGEDILNGTSGKTPDFTIPKPYYVDKAGEKHEVEWKWSEENKTLSVSFSPESYPVALDPTLSFTAPGVSNSGSVIGGEAASDQLGSVMATGDFNADGKLDLVVGGKGYATNTGRVYIFYNDGAYPTKADAASVVITGGGGLFGQNLTTGDWNADGRVDVAASAFVTNTSPGVVYVFYNDGSMPTTAATADVTITGESNFDGFGVNLIPGDFNADGKVDLTIAANGYSGGASAGRVYVFYNGSITTEAASGADVIITGEASSFFGDSLTSGDFNADGEVDLAVGAYHYASENGRAYIFYNGSITTEAATGADIILTGVDGRFGNSMAAGDFNADGKMDIVVGAQSANSFQGRAYIFYGGSMITESASGADVTISGESSYFATSLTAGDLNTDGRTDLVVAVSLYSSGLGRTYVFYNDGSIPTAAATADVIITGEVTGDSFGVSLTTGDFNADGKVDLAVGAYGYASSTGRAYIFYSQNGTVNTNQSITGNATSDTFGVALTTGDFNADGRTDLAVGASGYSTSTGRAYIFYGDGQIPTGAATADVTITGEATSNFFGSSFTSGDFNADGKTDLAVGAYGYSSYTGRAYIFHNDGSIPTTAATADIIITGAATNDAFSITLTAGDLNADGEVDLAVGDSVYGHATTGHAYIFYNGSIITETAAGADVTITGNASSDYFGDALTAGDFNADGETDLAVGAWGYNSANGRTYIFYNDGSYPAGANSADVIITGDANINEFGISLAAGDFNTDGRIDLAVGARRYSSYTGYAYIFYNDGSLPTTAATADITITGGTTNDSFGMTLVAGDLNADGRTDLAIGAAGYSTNTGRAYIFYNDGSIPTTVATADVTITGETTSNYLSYYALVAGDMNGDGRTDLIVGAYGNTSSTGKVYIYETRENFAWEIQQPVGSGVPRTSLDTSGQELTITGEAGSSFGATFATGDFNADGKADLAVGAYSYYSNTGRVYIFYSDGSLTTGATNADVMISGGDGANIDFGVALTAGDFNADGRTDLAVSAQRYSTSTGRVYVFNNDGTYPATSATADTIITGETTSNYFGATLASGDWNADGKVDLAVGASTYSSSAGRAYIFYNGAITTENASGADIAITGEASSALGGALASGDWNADGKVDLAVGASSYSSSAGRAYIFYNGSIITEAATGADIIITGGGSFHNFGFSLVSGDWNADSRVDLAVGANGANTTYIFYNDGSIPTTAGTADVTISGESSASFGWSLTAGDFNADGRTDLAVGGYQYSSYTGRAYVFYNDGSIPTTAATADVIVTGETTTNYFGAALTSGDFNADGKLDLVVGALAYSSSAGKVYVYTFGNDSVITGGATSNYFGSALATGDFNADGRVDLAVGALGYSSNTGRLYIFYNNAGRIATALASADVVITGETASDQFARSLVPGDFNADGKTDIAVGASEYSSAIGRIYIFYNGSIVTEAASGADVILSGNGGIAYSRLGWSLAAADLDADGDTDLVSGTDSAGGYIDRAYLFNNDGSYPAGAATADVTFTGTSQTNFGSTVTTGDLNSDGRVDLVIGANYSGGGAYIFHNDGSMPTTAGTADVTITGESGNVYFTSSLTTGDFNTDGRVDLAVGSYGYSSNTGRAYIFYNDGSIPTTAETADAIITGESPNGYFGVNMKSGDWNADGRADLVVSAHQYSVENGRVYYFYNDGSYPSAAASADMSITGDTSFGDFGGSLAVADFNMDGKVDLVVGATGYSTDTGRVYILASEAAKATEFPGTMYLKGTGKMKGTGKIK